MRLRIPAEFCWTKSVFSTYKKCLFTVTWDDGGDGGGGGRGIMGIICVQVWLVCWGGRWYTESLLHLPLKLVWLVRLNWPSVPSLTGCLYLCAFYLFCVTPLCCTAVVVLYYCVAWNSIALSYIILQCAVPCRVVLQCTTRPFIWIYNIASTASGDKLHCVLIDIYKMHTHWFILLGLIIMRKWWNVEVWMKKKKIKSADEWVKEIGCEN